MKLKQIKIKNFRSYQDEISIDIDDLTAFVGRNDIGKSTVLEALDIFLNDGAGAVKIDANDVCKSISNSSESEIMISVVFSDLPNEIIIDDSNKTSFTREYLLNENKNLEVVKRYPNGGKAKVFIKAKHPTNSECADLLLKKQADLKKVLEQHHIECDNKTLNATMRQAIWTHFSGNLQLQEHQIDVSKEDAKNIWEKIKGYLPIYFLFQSDRKNTDGDSEVQDPLAFAMKQILQKPEIKEKLDSVADEIKIGLTDLADITLNKLSALNPDLARKLTANLPEKDSLKWDGVFKNVSIFDNNNIPINKRGSGVKRMILLSFFSGRGRKKSERRKE